MKLIKLTLTNFKGIKSFEFEPKGKNASVSRNYGNHRQLYWRARARRDAYR